MLPFRDMSALRSQVETAIADERARSGNSPAWARLVQLRGAIESGLENAVANRVMLEQRAMAQREMAAEDTMAAKLAEKVAAQKAAVDAAQRDILGKLIGASDPEDVVRVVGDGVGAVVAPS
jgi:ATP-dependent Clp protease ATP-binding subunit ClpA